MRIIAIAGLASSTTFVMAWLSVRCGEFWQDRAHIVRPGVCQINRIGVAIKSGGVGIGCEEQLVLHEHDSAIASGFGGNVARANRALPKNTVKPQLSGDGALVRREASGADAESQDRDAGQVHVIGCIVGFSQVIVPMCAASRFRCRQADRGQRQAHCHKSRHRYAFFLFHVVIFQLTSLIFLLHTHC